MKRSLILLQAALLLSACDPAVQQAVEDAMTDTSSSAAMEASSAMTESSSGMDDEGRDAGAVYTSYDSSVLSNGETKVLFFHAAWCPVCREADKELTQWYASGDPSLSVYKVDYDTETQLRGRYGVTYQHTFVLVDGEGNEIKSLNGPTDAALRTLIGA